MRIVNILSSVVQTEVIARIGVWYGTLKNSLVTSENTNIWQHYGFASRPKPADDNGCCEGLVLGNGPNEKIVATRDIRSIVGLGELEEGDSCLYSQVDKEALATVMCKENGTIFLTAPTELDSNGSPKKSHNFVMDTAAKAVAIQHESGNHITLTKENIILKHKEGTTIIISGSQIFIVGNLTIVGSVNATQLNVAGKPCLT